MNFLKKLGNRIADTLSSQAFSPYRFLPLAFLLGASAETFMIKAPLAGKGETFYDFTRRRESEKRYKALFGKLPDELAAEERQKIEQAAAKVEHYKPEPKLEKQQELKPEQKSQPEETLEKSAS